jgi:SAM-dependent methyltransferase
MERNIAEHNRAAWDRQVAEGDRWTVGVSPEVIAAVQRGEWGIVLTDTTPAPRTWFPETMAGVRVLCLASGGGQQGPMLAATGAIVTVFDNSPNQLAQDRAVAEREGLTLQTVQGDMRDLSMFADESFDLIVHPVSNLFVPDVRPVWREAYRVLVRGGALLAGFMNGFDYLFDWTKADAGVLEVLYKLPYSDLTSLTEEERAARYGEHAALEFGHSLDDQIGGQLAAGFVITGFYEDRKTGQPIADWMPSYGATKAVKM